MAIEPVPDNEELPTVPNRQTQKGNVLSNNMDAFSFAIGPWGDSIKLIGDNVYSNALEAEQFAQNSSDSAYDSASSASSSLSSAQASQSARDQAIATVSNLPDGTVDNGEPSQVNAWSSEKVAQLTNTSDNKPIFHADFTSQTYWGWKGFENGFVSGPLSEFFDFSRSTTQTAVSPAGVIKTIAVDKPLLGWEGGSPKGIELYPAVESLLAWSEDFTNAVWGKTSLTVNSDEIPSPILSLIASELVENSSSGGRYLNQNISVVSGMPYTYYVVAKKNTRDFVQIVLTSSGFGSNLTAVFDLNLLVSDSSGASATSGILPLSDGWCLCFMTATAVTTVSTGAQVRMANTYSTLPSNYTGDGVSSIYIASAQATQTSYPAPYQKTEGSSVTTDDNDCSLNADQFEFDGSGDWTIISKFNPLDTSQGSNNRYLTINDGTANNRLTISNNDGTPALIIAQDGGIQTLTQANLFTELSKIVIRKEGSAIDLFFNGSKVASTNLPSTAFNLSQIELGKGLSDAQRSATLFEFLEIHQKALTDAECEVATS